MPSCAAFRLLPALHHQRPLPCFVSEVGRAFLPREKAAAGAVSYLVCVEEGFQRLPTDGEIDVLSDL